MVVDQALSPQCVGREFVRQYYTLLNEAPAHLHRFYNNSSSFIHGEPDANNRETVTVVGQRLIHQRIQELNFRDCHAKITQVDSQATLGNGVVVQVTGELSNNGQPMRRFTQTFVLASQNPKKYYVHNDIFRYQDVLTDEDMEGDMARSDLAEEDQEQDVHQNDIRPTEPVQPEPYYTPTVNGTAEPKLDDVNMATDQLTQQMNSMNMNSLDMIQQPVSPMESQENGPIMVQNSNYVAIEPKEQLETQEPVQQQQVYHGQQSAPSHQTAPIQSSPPQLGSSEPKTYASTLVKTGTNLMANVYYNNTSPQPAVQPTVHSPSVPLPPAVSPPPQNQENKHQTDFRNSNPKPQRNDLPRSSLPSRPSNISDDIGNYVGSGDMDRRRPPPHADKSLAFPDSNQLFIGNVPISATEQQLRDVFEQYGVIADLRVLSKNNSNKQSGGKVPNFAFVIYHDQKAAQKVLNAKSITIPDGTSSVKLNIEKKTRKGSGEGGGRGLGGPRGGGMMNRGGNGGPLGGGNGNSRGGSGLTRGPMRGFNNSNPLRNRN